MAYLYKTFVGVEKFVWCEYTEIQPFHENMKLKSSKPGGKYMERLCQTADNL